MTFERQMAPLYGVGGAEDVAIDRPALWRRGSSIATICFTEVRPHLLNIRSSSDEERQTMGLLASSVPKL